MARGFLFFLLLLTAVPLMAANPVVVDFEDRTDSDYVTSQYAGLTFTNTVAFATGISINEFEFPPYSGLNVAVDADGPICIDFADSVLDFGAYFTYYEPLTLSFYSFDGSNYSLIHSLQSTWNSNIGDFDGDGITDGDPGSSPNEWLSWASDAGFSRVEIAGNPWGYSFTMDNLTYTPVDGAAPVPEPATISLMLAGCALLLAGKKFQSTRR